MKKEQLLSLLYIPLTLCAFVPSKRAAEEAVSINNNVDAKDPQELLNNAQRILQDAVNQQLDEMNMDVDDLWGSASEDIQKILEDYSLDDYLMNEPTLQEDAPPDLIGGLFGGFEKGIKGITDGITTGLTGKPPTKVTGTVNDKKPASDTKVDIPIVEPGNKKDDGDNKDGDFLGGLFGSPEKSKNDTNGFHISLGLNNSESSSPLSGILGGSNSVNGSVGLHFPNLFNNSGSPPDLTHGFVSGVTNVTNGLFGNKGIFHFGDGIGLDNFAGAVGSTFGKFFNGNLFGGIPGSKTGDFLKGISDKISSFFPEPKAYNDFYLVPLISGTLNMLGSTVVGLLKSVGGLALNLFPKAGAFGAQHLPGFLRYQTHEYLVEDLSHLKNVFLGAMRVESPIAAEQFDIFFDKFYTLLERAYSVDPSMAQALTAPTEENIRAALQSLSKVISDF